MGATWSVLMKSSTTRSNLITPLRTGLQYLSVVSICWSSACPHNIPMSTDGCAGPICKGRDRLCDCPPESFVWEEAAPVPSTLPQQEA